MYSLLVFIEKYIWKYFLAIIWRFSLLVLAKEKCFSAQIFILKIFLCSRSNGCIYFNDDHGMIMMTAPKVCSQAEKTPLWLLHFHNEFHQNSEDGVVSDFPIFYCSRTLRAVYFFYLSIFCYQTSANCVCYLWRWNKQKIVFCASEIV